MPIDKKGFSFRNTSRNLGCKAENVMEVSRFDSRFTILSYLREARIWKVSILFSFSIISFIYSPFSKKTFPVIWLHPRDKVLNDPIDRIRVTVAGLTI